MGKFDYDAPAELFAGGGGIRSKGSVRYLRFDSAAKAIQYAIEQIPLGQRSRSVLEVGEERYEPATIQKLYVSTEYPLDRSYPSVFLTDADARSIESPLVTKQVSSRADR